MPPKARFSKEEIIHTALDIVRQDGFEALTARALGSRLNSSARPIFTVFKNMEEVHAEVKLLAREVYNQYVKTALTKDLAFKAVGLAYIQFAKEEPKLFQILYMSETAPKSKAEVIMYKDDNHEEICNYIKDNFALSHEDAWHLYEQLWIYSHGIATLCATRVCSFEEEEMDSYLTEIFKSLLINIKKERAKE